MTVRSAADSLAAFLDASRAGVDRALDRYLPRPPSCPPLMSEAMRYSVFAGGKRFRPILALAAADAVSRRSPEGLRHERPPVAQGFSPAIDLALPAACAIELIHTYSLIHDDLPAMDDDTLRRGRPTLHVVYGDGIAILAGDGLHAEAFSLLAREPAAGAAAGIDDGELTARKLRVIQTIADAAGAIGMVGGQAIDLQAAGQAVGERLTLDADGVRLMHAKKTGALIRASAVTGAIMAGAGADQTASVDRYAADLGLAFQIVDDILDVEGESHELGKTAGKDAADSKPTYPALFGIDRSRALATEAIDRAKSELAGAHLTDGWLVPIADWILNRRS
jgi:geranylgeranyl diphosphate synthase, type II